MKELLTTEAFEEPDQAALAALLSALADGWETSRLQLPGGPELYFQRRVRVRLEYIERKREWIAGLPELNASELGATPADALGRLVELLRQETSAMVRALTHQLSDLDRLRKQQLLGTIDIVASSLQAEVPDFVWVIGELSDEGQQIEFRTYDDTRHELSPDVLESLVFERSPRFARFATDAVGRAHGPVLELDHPFRGGPR